MSQFLHVGVVYTAKMYSKNYECVIIYANDERCAAFSLKMHQKRLAAGFRPDLLVGGSLQRSQTPSWI